MTQKTRKITGWVHTGIVALVFIGSASMETGIKNFTSAINNNTGTSINSIMK